MRITWKTIEAYRAKIYLNIKKTKRKGESYVYFVSFTLKNNLNKKETETQFVWLRAEKSYIIYMQCSPKKSESLHENHAYVNILCSISVPETRHTVFWVASAPARWKARFYKADIFRLFWDSVTHICNTDKQCEGCDRSKILQSQHVSLLQESFLFLSFLDPDPYYTITDPDQT